MESSALFQLADELKDLRRRKDELEEKLKEVKTEIARAEAELLQEMINEELGNFKRGDTQFVMVTKVHASPKAGKKPLLIRWLKQSQYRDLVKEDVNARTLEAWARELAENDELPDEVKELVNIFEKQTITIRKAK